MKTALQLFLIVTLSFAVGKIIAEQLPLTTEQLLPEVGQKDKKFSIEHLTIKVGDAVKFTNEDPFFHNVFSLSAAATFDLGSFPLGESRSVTFDEPGEVDIECAIHPSMRMVIEVEE